MNLLSLLWRRPHAIVFGLWILNLFDAISTHLALGQGWATEMNPVANELYSQHPAALALTKVFVATLVCFWFWENWSVMRRRGLAFFVTLVYAITMAVHGGLWVYVMLAAD